MAPISLPEGPRRIKSSRSSNGVEADERATTRAHRSRRYGLAASRGIRTVGGRAGAAATASKRHFGGPAGRAEGRLAYE